MSEEDSERQKSRHIWIGVGVGVGGLFFVLLIVWWWWMKRRSNVSFSSDTINAEMTKRILNNPDLSKNIRQLLK